MADDGMQVLKRKSRTFTERDPRFSAINEVEMEEMDSSYKSIKKKEGLVDQGYTGGNKAGRHKRNLSHLSIDPEPLPSLGN